MKYTVFNVEQNEADYKVELNRLNRSEREVGLAIWGTIKEHQQIANERHNEAMLKKDIEIAELQGALKALKAYTPLN